MTSISSTLPNTALTSRTFFQSHPLLLRRSLSTPLKHRRKHNLHRSEMAAAASVDERNLTSTSTPALPPLPDRRIILGVGGVSVDYLAMVAAFPKPDDKIRSTSTKVQGGGNAGNALTSATRLGLTPRLISKVADDAQGRSLLAELEADGVDTSYIVVSEGGNSPFTYIIVDSETNSRTCIHTPGYPVMVPHDLSQSSLFSALDEARLVYFDVRLHETALVVAQECRQPEGKFQF